MANTPAWLLDFRSDVTSSDGEDGIIEKIFSIIGDGSRTALELGALNGRHDSNVWNLIKNKGWKGVLIEADRTYFERLEREYAGNPRAYCLNAFVSFEGEQSLDAILAATTLPCEFDLFSLDVDGNEYHLWASMQRYRPRVVVVEFNPSIPNNISFIQPRDMSVYQGSSLRALADLARGKGYELIAANSVNAFFVVKELFAKFNIADNSLDAVHTDRSFETQLFQLYDGTLKIAGNRMLIWHKLPIGEEKLQVLPRRKRVYPAMISPNPFIRALKYAARKLPFYPIAQRIRAAFK